MKRQRCQEERQQCSTQEGYQQPDGRRARSLLPALSWGAAHPGERLDDSKGGAGGAGGGKQQVCAMRRLGGQSSIGKVSRTCGRFCKRYGAAGEAWQTGTASQEGGSRRWPIWS